MNATWLFAEAYKYRRLRECFTVSKNWAHYDVFFRQKVRVRCVFSQDDVDAEVFPSAILLLAPQTPFSSCPCDSQNPINMLYSLQETRRTLPMRNVSCS